MNIRVGHGFDVHSLVAGRKLILCGIDIPAELGLLGHSDADVAVHALMDALLGALALKDIGYYFPDTDPEYAGADSIELLKKVMKLPAFSGWEISNIDLTIIAQYPKISPYREAMINRISQALEISSSMISIKATTTEKLGFIGRKEGIVAECVVLLLNN